MQGGVHGGKQGDIDTAKVHSHSLPELQERRGEDVQKKQPSNWSNE